jgi:hypothetical protein
VKAALLALLIATPALADANDDYAACLIGHAAVELHKQAVKDADAAQTAAYAVCSEPAGIEENEAEGLSDFVAMSVEALAGQ